MASLNIPRHHALRNARPPASADAITFASRVKREALVGVRSSPFLAQVVSTAGSPIALAGRASCAAAVALVAAATRNVIDIPHL